MKIWEMIYIIFMVIMGIMSFLVFLNLYGPLFADLDTLFVENLGFSFLNILPTLLLLLGVVFVCLSGLLALLGLSPDQEMGTEFYGDELTPSTLTPLMFLVVVTPFILATELFVVLTTLGDLVALSGNLVGISIRIIIGVILAIIVLIVGVIGGAAACTLIYSAVIKISNYKWHIVIGLSYSVIGYIVFLVLNTNLTTIAILFSFLSFYPALSLLIPLPNLKRGKKDDSAEKISS
ncbi:MAG: hypothetical protein ACFFCZ_03705 [Promethearchaeota archaeon]